MTGECCAYGIVFVDAVCIVLCVVDGVVRRCCVYGIMFVCAVCMLCVCCFVYPVCLVELLPASV